jgi:transglutaminase-like putative cysteine protease
MVSAFLRRVTVPLAVAALIVVAGLSMDRVYNGHLLVELVSGAAAGSVLVSVALRRAPAWLVAPVSVLAMVGYSVVAVNLSAHAGGVPGGLRTLAVDAARNAVPRLLTALIPVEPQPDTVLAPVILAWLAGFAGAEVASRTRRPALALVPPTLLYVGALVLVGPNAGTVAWEPLAFAGIAAAGLVAGGAASGARSLPGMAPRQRTALRLRTFSGLAVGLVAVLAIVAVAAPLVARAVHHSPTDPRRYVAPPTLDTLDQNPLIRISGWAADPSQRLFRVSVLKSGRTQAPTPTPVPSPAVSSSGPSTGVIAADNTPDPTPTTDDSDPGTGAYDTRLRLAVLTDWDGVTWHVDADYRSAGRVLPPVTRAPGMDTPDPDAPPPLTIQESITVDNLEGRLMPAVSAPSRVDGVRVAFDQSSGTLLQTDPLAPGVSYTVTSTNPSVNVTILPAADVPSGPAVARYLRVGDTVPNDLTQLATTLASQESSPYLRALGLESFLKEHFRYAADAPSGHAYPNLRFFLFEDPRAGGQRGTSEQFATAFATLGRLMGLPTRVVVGFRTPSGGGEITGADALAWPEVLFSGVGWVAFNPIPESDTPPRPLEDEFLPKPTPPPNPPSSAEPPSPPTVSAPPAVAQPGRTGVGGPGAGIIAGGIGGGVVLLLILFLVVIMALRLRRRSQLARGSPPERVLGAWDEVLDTLVLAGAPPPEHLAVAEVADHAQLVAGGVPGRRHARRPRPAAPGLHELARNVNEVGFAGELSSTDEVTAFAAGAQARAFERALRAGLPWWRRLLWRVDPRPLRRRR